MQLHQPMFMQNPLAHSTTKFASVDVNIYLAIDYFGDLQNVTLVSLSAINESTTSRLFSVRWVSEKGEVLICLAI